MRTHTRDFKNEIKRFGREIDSKIMYGTTELGKEQLNSVTPHYEGSLLKSVMKQLDVDSNVEIPLETVINYQFGVKVGNSYEYLNYGNYVVYNVEKQEDTKSWKITCYDKMLYAMKDYESLGVTYPITVKNFLSAICTKLGLTLASDDFVNADKEILNELYLDSDGNSLGYTYRDVLDELSQVVAGIICINNNDELEVRYSSNVGEYETVEGTNFYLGNVDDTDDISYELNGNTVQDGTPSPDSPIEIQTVTGRQSINICGKNIFNFNDTYYKRYTNTDVTIENNSITVVNNNTYTNGYVWWNIPVKIGESINISFESIVSGNDNDNNKPYYYFVDEPVLSYNTSFFQNVVDVEQSYIDKQLKNKTVISTEKYLFLALRIRNGVNGYTINNLQVEYNTQPTSYEEYTGQNYELNLGKNLFDKDNANVKNWLIANSTQLIQSSSNEKSVIIKVKPNTTYTISKMSTNRFRVGEYPTLPDVGDTVNNYVRVGSDTGTSTTITTLSTTNYLVINIVNVSNVSYNLQDTLDSIQIEKGSSATSYSPYKTPIELCKIGNYQDKIYKENGKWYLHKETGKIILNGSESWTITNTGTVNYRYKLLVSSNNIKYQTPYPITNKYVRAYVSSTNTEQGFNLSYATATSLQLHIRYGVEKTIEDFKAELENENLILLHALIEPTDTLITDTELINQLEAIRLQLGVNNISVDSPYLSSPLRLTYLKYWETIDEEMLKNVNVNFGDKFGPVNSVVLSRSAESDNIYRKDNESVELNGLTEIKIKDNQILNGNNRDDFIDGIFDKLKGLEYYVNDYVSTGIAYLELGDFYKVKVEDNYYKCLMLNDELDVTQGLEEPIHAERMEDSETDYTKADKTDRKINQTYLIVDKQNQEINSVVQNVNTLQTVVNSQGEQIDSLGTRITQNIDSITASVSSIQSELDNGVSLVKTTSVIVNDEGLTVATDTSKTQTIMTSDKFIVRSGGKDLAYFGYDDEIGSTKAQMDNLTVTNYFVAGYHRTEKMEENGEHRTGVFYIGG